MRLSPTLVIGLTCALCATNATAQSFYIATCSEGAEIQQAKRTAIATAAERLIHLALASDAAGIEEIWSAAVKGRSAQTQTVIGALKQFQPKGVAVRHVYLIGLKGKSPGRVTCELDSTTHDEHISVAADTLDEQAYVTLTARALDNELVFTMWLTPEGGWKVRSFWMGFATMAGKDAKQVLEWALREAAAGHPLNAHLLARSASDLADRGPNLRLEIAERIAREREKLSVPADVRGSPPYAWRAGDAAFSVKNVWPVAIDGKVFVAIAHEVAPWQRNEDVDALNKKLIAEFKRRFPEYSAVFAGIAARALERGTTRGFGTIDP